jgi:NitT/TauT family transport system ATP-binding protein
MAGEIGNSPFVRVRDLSIRFGNAKSSLLALDGVSLDIREGEFMSVVGPSGCGKSTLLLGIAGLLRPSAGTVLIRDALVASAYTDAGIAFQNHNLLEWRTVLRNVMLPVEIRGMDERKFLPRAEQLLALVGLCGFENKYPHQLSGGMRQRVSICRALVCDLPLLLMDEPFGSLDALSREEHQLLLQDVWLRERKTVLFITHDIREAVLLSDRVAVMSPRPGRLLDIFDIDLARPRDQSVSETPVFNDYARRIRAVLNTASTRTVEMAP